MNNPNLSDMINDDDEAAFQYLSNLVVVEYEDVKPGYKITFVRQKKYNCYYGERERGRGRKEVNVSEMIIQYLTNAFSFVNCAMDFSAFFKKKTAL